MDMTDGWVRYLGLSTLFLGASFHRLLLVILYSKALKETRHRELSLFLGLLSLSCIGFFLGFWGSLQESYAWSMKSMKELGPFLSIGVGAGLLFSFVVSLPGKKKMMGIALIGTILLLPFLMLPRIFKGWIPVWGITELCSLEIVRLDREGTGVILNYPKAGIVYVYLPERTPILQIQQRLLPIGYRLFNLPPLYCKIESLGAYIFTQNKDSNGIDLLDPILKFLPQQIERRVSLSLDTMKLLASYSVRCTSRGEIQFREE